MFGYNVCNKYFVRRIVTFIIFQLTWPLFCFSNVIARKATDIQYPIGLRHEVSFFDRVHSWLPCILWRNSWVIPRQLSQRPSLSNNKLYWKLPPTPPALAMLINRMEHQQILWNMDMQIARIADSGTRVQIDICTLDSLCSADFDLWDWNREFRLIWMKL